jgi:hypothetical protein
MPAFLLKWPSPSMIMSHSDALNLFDVLFAANREKLSFKEFT